MNTPHLDTSVEPIISVKNLRKEYQAYDRREGVWGSFLDLFNRDYKTVLAVDSISFTVQPGELVGYIGPNGAGKSTSIKMLTGILQPTSGEMSVKGYHPFRQRKEYTKHIGVVFGQRTQLWWDIAVEESFRLLAKIYDVPKADYDSRLGNLSEILGLGELLRTPVRKLSLGQRMRCDLAASLLHNPQVVFLDEPTIGLDAVAKDSIRSFLRRVNREFKTTILLTTHDLKEIEELCKRIIVLDHGRIIFDGRLSEIKNLPGLTRTITVDFAGEAPLERLQGELGEKISLQRESSRRLEGSFDPRKLPAAELIRALFSAGEVADLAITEPSIEEVIMKLYRDGVTPRASELEAGAEESVALETRAVKPSAA